MIRLQAVDLAKHFGPHGAEVAAVDGVSLSLGAGESVAVVGASGSGKSTLLSLLALLERPDRGTVSLEGKALGGLGESALAALRGRNMGIVFQSFRLLPQLSALENVRVPLDIAGDAQADLKARVWLDRVGLAARAGHRPGELSGGEQQRVALARALVREPSVVLADEPSGNLDSVNGALMADLLFGLARGQGASLLLVTHDAGLAARADRVLAMKDGRLVP
jgi:putative ABC transport system ATP-binding protein